MKTNIALIGFMGTGKTAVGRLLAKKLGRKFIELDSVIEKKAGKSIPEIFMEDGEIAFRELEIEATKEVARKKRAVIACGGGVVLNRINIDRLKEGAVMIHLTAPPSVVLKRTLREVGKRPLLNVDNPLATIHELLKFRKPLYERAADTTINTGRLDISAVAQQIIDKLKQDESFAW
jgi:shikimate kinase